MLKSKSTLAVDCGASTLKVAEFEPNNAGGLRLKRYALRPLGLEGSQEATRERAMTQGLAALLGDNSFSAKHVNICAPGFHVFSKFVKLPPVDAAKVTQIIQYEAQQNVPFPLEEVVWDYQILGTSPSGEFEVLLVAIKADVVEGLFRAGESAGLKPVMVDVSPAALCNAFRFNYGELEGCTVVLDVGAKTSNVLFFEKGKVYSRSINIGANSITQDFANEAKLSFLDAEAIKIEKGFVSLGGAYEEPDDPQAAQISKIARQVMTRLHIQVNQTIQFYRNQQGGSAPQRLLLAGGASIMPYTAQFFAEKLGVEVEYFNPLRNIEIDPSLNLEELAKVAHSLGEVVGLGLRSLAHCPVEMNLMPKSSLRRHEFNQKVPFFLAAAFSLVAVVFSYAFLKQKIVDVKRNELDSLQAQYQPLVANRQTLEREMQLLAANTNNALLMQGWMEDRSFWPSLLPALRTCLLQTELAAKQQLNLDAGIWIERMAVELPGRPVAGDPSLPPPPIPGVGGPAGSGGPPPRGMRGPRRVGPEQPSITNVILVVRSVDMRRPNLAGSSDPAGNTKVAYTLLSQLHGLTALFDTNGTAFRGSITEDTNTFSTEINLKLKRPIPL